LFFIVVVIKFYLLNIALILASTSVHEKMIEAITRCPSRFFDVNPSGILVNKFSTDLGIIDGNLIYGLMDAIEGPIMIVIAIANISEINLYFLIPAFVLSVVAVIFFIYARPASLNAKHLDLQKKSPIFHFYSETSNGLTQIKVYGQRNANIEKICHIINKSTQATIGFEMVSAAYGFYETLIAIVLIAVGIVMGIAQISS
jgi:ATP-binding cassette, subfamily C (CFTR/MRP), member 4